MSHKRFFTSDQHFGHANILKYEAAMRRDEFGSAFRSVDKMDDYIVDQWNAHVAPDDIVYCLGDFCYKLQQTCDMLPFLNGEKILVCGNHDPFFENLNSTKVADRALARELALQAGFSEVHLELAVEIKGIGRVLLSHFPYEPSNKEGLSQSSLRYLINRPAVGKEKMLLHGHVHSQWLTHQEEGKPFMLNVGIDVWGMRPVYEDDIVDLFKGQSTSLAKQK